MVVFLTVLVNDMLDLDAFSAYFNVGLLPQKYFGGTEENHTITTE